MEHVIKLCLAAYGGWVLLAFVIFNINGDCLPIAGLVCSMASK